MPSDKPRDVPRIRFTDLVKRERRVVEYPDRNPFDLIEMVVRPHLGITTPETQESRERFEAVMRARRLRQQPANDAALPQGKRRFNRYR